MLAMCSCLRRGAAYKHDAESFSKFFNAKLMALDSYSPYVELMFSVSVTQMVLTYGMELMYGLEDRLPSAGP